MWFKKTHDKRTARFVVALHDKCHKVSAYTNHFFISTKIRHHTTSFPIALNSGHLNKLQDRSKTLYIYIYKWEMLDHMAKSNHPYLPRVRCRRLCWWYKICNTYGIIIDFCKPRINWRETAMMVDWWSQEYEYWLCVISL